ncbi:hypothetical protein ACQKFK_32665, partial [Bacillus mycoides]|uniref:hypothetical protein n=1 Tax=Bacillus mycoides TaxID=1405 RepID=UPI003CFBDD2D
AVTLYVFYHMYRYDLLIKLFQLIQEIYITDSESTLKMSFSKASTFLFIRKGIVAILLPHT